MPYARFQEVNNKYRDLESVAATLGVLSSVRRAAKLPPAEAMRPEPPANYRPSLIERTGIAHFFSNTFRIAVRAVVKADGKFFTATREVKITVGGCG